MKKYYILITFYFATILMVFMHFSAQFNIIFYPPEKNSLKILSGTVIENSIKYNKWKGIRIKTGNNDEQEIFCDIPSTPLNTGSPKSTTNIYGECDWIGLPDLNKLYGKKIEALVYKNTIYELKIENFYISYETMVEVYQGRFWDHVKNFIYLFVVGLPLVAAINYILVAKKLISYRDNDV